MRRHALFVGVDQYVDGHIPNLSCAVNDATDLHGFFRWVAMYDQVELLQNPSSKKEVLGKVRNLTAGLGPGDFFLFFFAGHGFRVGENHVLVCSNDLYDDVRYEDDGLPLGQLKRHLSGTFDSALLLDACQSDILATRGGEGIAERDLSLILDTSTERSGGGALTIVTSCDAGQTAAELSEMQHGLFTVAILDLLREAQKTHARIDLSDSFRLSLGQRMGEIAARSGLPTEQRPRFSSSGLSCFALLEGEAAALNGTGNTSVQNDTEDRNTGSNAGQATDKNDPPKPVPSSERTHEVTISNWTVELAWGMPGCDENTLSFTLFETLGKFLCLLNGLGKYDGKNGEKQVFGNPAFRDSAWGALSGKGESAPINCPPLTGEDKKAIAKAGGMERLARKNRVWALFKELEIELEKLKADLLNHCTANKQARHARVLVCELSKCLEIEGAK